jgi:PleD family two-component response regulator
MSENFFDKAWVMRMTENQRVEHANAMERGSQNLQDNRPEFDEFLDRLGSNMENKENEKLNRQEENWMLMTTLQIPWVDANRIEDSNDREFLMNKVKEVQKYLKEQESQMRAQQAEMMRAQNQQGGGSKIITPQELGL